MKADGTSRATAIQLSDDDDEATFRLQSRIPAPNATGGDSDFEEGQDMDISFGCDGETDIRFQQDGIVPTAGTLGDFTDVWALIQAEKDKLRRIRVIRDRKEKPDLMIIPQSATIGSVPAYTADSGTSEGSSAAPIDVDAAIDMAPIREALGSLSLSKPSQSEAVISPHSLTKSSKAVLPAHVTQDKATANPASLPLSLSTSNEGDSPMASSPHHPSPLHRVRYASTDYDESSPPARKTDKLRLPLEDAYQATRVDKPRLPLPVRERAANLLQKLVHAFPEERAAFARAEALGAIPPPEGSRPSVYIHVDFSNVHVGFLEWCKSQGIYDPRARLRRRPKLDLHSLFAILERGRAARRRILVGSRPLAQGLELAEEWRYELHILDRVHKRQAPRPGFVTDSGGSADDSSDADVHHRGRSTTMREQAVDEVLQLKIYETVTRPSSPKGGGKPVLVLATGDGNRGEFSEGGFIAPVRIALAAGFDVEVFSFRAGLSSAWRAERKRSDRMGGKHGELRINELDVFGEELVA